MSGTHFRVLEHVVTGQHVREYPSGTSGNQNEELAICVKQYIPLEWLDSDPPEGAITIVGAHANGMPKELYEPLWDDLLEVARGKFHIRGIWMADVMNQGESFQKNGEKLGDDPSWFDSSRDLLQIINKFRREMPRPIVGLGHSYGAVQLFHLSLFHPRLFSSLILVDPIIVPVAPNTKIPGLANPWGGIFASTVRRDLWSSKAAAVQSLHGNPFYKSWDPRVFEKLTRFAFTEIPTLLYPDVDLARKAATKKAGRSKDEATGVADRITTTPVTLKTTKHQEVMTFVRPNFDIFDAQGNRIYRPRTHPDSWPDDTKDYPFYRPEGSIAYQNLPYLRPSTLYILGGTSGIATPEERKAMIARTGIGKGGNGGETANQIGSTPGIAGLGTKGVTIPKRGHLLVMEDPRETAVVSAQWLRTVGERWKVDEEEYKEITTKKGRVGHLTLSKEFLKAIHGSKPGEDWKSKL